MKVSENSAIKAWDPKSAGKTSGSSDEFSRILKRKEEIARRGENSKPATEDTPAVPQGGLASNTEQPNTYLPPDVDGPRSSSGQIDIQKITAEIVHEIHATNNGDGRRSVDIEFNSKTLAGLKVHLELKDKTLSINFSTQSESVATLLNNQSADLRRALEASGLRVSGIVVSGGKSSSNPGSPRQSNWRGGRN